MTPPPATAPLVAISYGRNSLAKDRSIASQLDENRAEAERLGWTVAHERSDRTSASAYARGSRDGWPALLALVPEVDVVILWEASRGDRTLASWVAFLDLCKAHRVLIHATGHGTTYDPRKPREYRALAEDGVDATYESDKMALRLRRGNAAAAAAGRPHSQPPYGYEREYDPRTGRPTAQRPREDQAEIVREIIRRVGERDAIIAIARDLTAREVPSPEGLFALVSEVARRIRRGADVDEVAAYLREREALGRGRVAARVAADMAERLTREVDRQRPSVVAAELAASGALRPLCSWYPQTVRAIASNAAYVGRRVHRPSTAPGTRTESEATWPALVTEAAWYAAQRQLATAVNYQRPGRPRDGKATTLLGAIVVCGTCGGTMASKRSRGRWVYRCCPMVDAAELEAFVTALLIERLSRADVYRALRHHSDADDRAAVEARTEVKRLTEELDGWRASAIRGETTPASLAVVEAGLSARITAARRTADAAAIPPSLRRLVEPGADVAARFDELTLGARRALVRRLVRVTVHSTRGRRGADLVDRTQIEWLTA